MRLRQAFTALCLSLGTATPGFSGDLPKTLEDVVRVELLPGWRQADGTHIAALSFQLAKGWKTYWRSPGDGGLPTRLNADASENLSAMRIMWPRPEVFRIRGLRAIGYQDELVLPLHLTPQDADSVELDITLDFGVCEDVCIPVRMSFEDQLPGTDTDPDERIVAAMIAQPETSSYALKCTFENSSNASELTVEFHAPLLPGRGEAVVIEAEARDIWISEPVVMRDGDYITATSEIVAQGASDMALRPGDIRVTLISSQAARSYQGCPGF